MPRLPAHGRRRPLGGWIALWTTLGLGGIALVGACILNPQPQPPNSEVGDAGASSGGAARDAATAAPGESESDAGAASDNAVGFAVDASTDGLADGESGAPADAAAEGDGSLPAVDGADSSDGASPDAADDQSAGDAAIRGW